MLPLHTPRSVVLLCLLFIPCLSLSAAETWRGLIVADESPCPGYDRKRDYLDTEQAVTARQGPRSLYTGRIFDDLRDSQVDHIVAIREADESGLCKADRLKRHRFAYDLDNLTLASRSVNAQKGKRDAAEWLPAINQCWYAERVIAIKLKYDLTVDRQEMLALDGILAGCEARGPQPPLRHALAGGPAEPRWLTGGTLHEATLADWRSATYANKVSTAANLALGAPAVKRGLRGAESLDAAHAILVPLVVELVVCVELGIEYALAGGKAGLPVTSMLESTSVADSAAYCLRGWGWEKE